MICCVSRKDGEASLNDQKSETLNFRKLVKVDVENLAAEELAATEGIRSSYSDEGCAVAQIGEVQRCCAAGVAADLSTPSFLNMLLIPRNACRVRSSFSISAKRT